MLSTNASDAKIQAALDGLEPGGEVLLSPGIYQIRRPLILRHDNQTLRGSGPQTVLFLANKANCPVVILGSPLLGPARTTTHLRLADLTIDGNRKNQQVELWRPAIDGSQLNNNGVDIWNVDGVTVEHVTCSRCRSGGLVTATTRHLKLSDYSAFDNQFDGLACYYTEDSIFTGLKLHDNLCAGISLDLAFNHNIFNDTVLTGNDLGIFMRYSCNNLFKGLTISKSRKDGVFIAQAATGTPKGWVLAPGTECKGNCFDGLTVNSCGRNAFTVNNVSCSGNVVREARFMDNHGGLVQGDGKPSVVSITMAEQPKLAIRPMQAMVIHQ